MQGGSRRFRVGIKKLSVRFSGLALFITVLIFYIYTLAPSLNWADGARMQMDVILGGSSYAFLEEVSHIPTDGLPFHRLGVAAWDHPLYVMLGRIFLQLPVGGLTYRINLMSAILGALAITFVYKLGMFFVHDRWSASLGALALAVSHTYWFHSVTSEVYTLNILLMVSLIWWSLKWVKQRRWNDLALSSLVAGLGLANHRLFILVLLPVAIYLVVTTLANGERFFGKREPNSPRQWSRLSKIIMSRRGLMVVGAFMIGFAPWWIQFIRMARIIGVPMTLELATTFSLIEKRLSVGSFGVFAENFAIYFVWLLYQFTIIGVGLGIGGFFYMWRKQAPLAGFFLGVLILHVAFSANFSVGDQFNFHLPSYVVFDLGIIWGAAKLRQRLDLMLRSSRKKLDSLGSGRVEHQIWAFPREVPKTERLLEGILATLLVAVVLFPPVVYAFVPQGLRFLGITESSLGIYPIGTGARDVARYFLNPNKRGENSPARFGRSTLNQLAPNALVFTPKTSEQEAYVVLRYFQKVEGLRSDVRLDMMLFEPLEEMPQAVLARAHEEKWCRPLYISSLNPVSFPIEQLEAEFELVPEANLFRLVLRQPRPENTVCQDSSASLKQVPLDELIRRALHWP